MRSPITVIIPTLNAADSLAGCAAALIEGLQAGLIREVIISDGGSHDATAAIADGIGADIVAGSASRGGQLRRGAARAKGAWLLFLHADTQLAEGWSRAVGDHLAQASLADGPAGYFRLGFDGKGVGPRIVAMWGNLRARCLGLPFGDQGFLIPAQLYAQIDGHPDIPVMEDMAIARKLRARLVPLDATARTSFARYRRDGWLRRGTANLVLQIRYLTGAKPDDLARRYTRQGKNAS